MIDHSTKTTSLQTFQGAFASISQATPMMVQYLQIKKNFTDYFLFYRMGDFYELFFEDALHGAPLLEVALTRRGLHAGLEIPMCGVPSHALDTYLAKLVKQGHRVAICEQLEDPEEAKKRGYKAVVKRDVLRIITPGTLLEDTLLEAKQPNYLVSLVYDDNQTGMAWVDISTGEVGCRLCPQVEMTQTQLQCLNPQEILVAEELLQQPDYFDLFKLWKDQIRPQRQPKQRQDHDLKRLTDLYQVQDSSVYGQFPGCVVVALLQALDYVKLTNQGQLPYLHPPKLVDQQNYMVLDPTTWRSLEITQTLAGDHKGSLLHSIDRTLTAAGARLLYRRLMHPLLDPQKINQRLDLLTHFVTHADKTDEARQQLKMIPDLERALSRLSVKRGSPRDVGVVRDVLQTSQTLWDIVKSLWPETNYHPTIQPFPTLLMTLHGLAQRLTSALIQTLPLSESEGDYIATGYSEELDQLRNLRDQGQAKIDALEQTYRDQTGISSLKIRQNAILGYYIETTHTHAAKLKQAPWTETFIHRQTMVNATRWITQELIDFEQILTSAADRVRVLQTQLFQQLCDEIIGLIQPLHQLASLLAELDVALGLAVLAQDQHYCRPEIDDSVAFDIQQGRHPVVEVALKKQASQAFISNNCNLSPQQNLWLLTGPNMAGKSTFLRQNALIILMAQIGSYVPAEAAHIGVVDRLFTRIGAGDDLAQGRSTFMVEMMETATILHQATTRSLVILDELGRGTSTYDGLAIAWAALEHLHTIKRCRTLFATHYHELTSLAKSLDRLTCYTMKVKEWKESIIFLHEVIAGAADRSYGIHVAEKAGLPLSVIKRAQQVLQDLEAKRLDPNKQASSNVLPLFPLQPSAQEAVQTLHPILVQIDHIDIDNLTPRQAWEILEGFKNLMEKAG